MFPEGESRGADLYVTIKVADLAERYGDLTLSELVKKFRSSRTGKRPSRISFVRIGRNGDHEPWCVFP